MSNVIWECTGNYENLEDSLFDVFKECYAMNDVVVYFKEGTLEVHKYNVLGLSLGTGVFSVYDNPSLDIKLCSFNVEDVVKIEVI